MTTGEIKRRGLIMVLSSPSGAGKTTISRALLEGDANLVLSVSATTRPKRDGETDGVDYDFVTPERFEEMIQQDAFLEHAKVFSNRYGTPRARVEKTLAAGQDILFDIDWQGTQQVAEKALADLVRVFILPPSTEELRKRLETRARDPEDVVRERMARATDEMSHWAEYDYVIVNRNIEESVARARTILAAERLKRARMTGLSEFVKSLQPAG